MKSKKSTAQRFNNSLYALIPVDIRRDSKFKENVGIEPGDKVNIEIKGESLRITKKEE